MGSSKNPNITLVRSLIFKIVWERLTAIWQQNYVFRTASPNVEWNGGGGGGGGAEEEDKKNAVWFLNISISLLESDWSHTVTDKQYSSIMR